MNRKCALLVLSMLLSCLNAYAGKDWVHRFEAALNVADKIPSHATMGTAAYWGGDLAYGLNKNFGVGISGGFADSRFEVNKSDTSANIHAGSLSLTPVFFDMIYHATTESPVLYGVLGLGGLFVKTRGTGGLDALNLRAVAHDGYAVKLGVGIDLSANENWIYNFEADYVFTDAKLDIVDAKGNEISSKNVGFWRIGAGLKYLFD